jgi:hypothetical protein
MLAQQRDALLAERPMEGIAGATFCIWWSEVNEESDGPLEWCRPVPADRAHALAEQIPEFSVRTEPAHWEAFVNLGPGGQITPAQSELVSASLHAWAEENKAHPTYLGVRVTYLVPPPPTEGTGPDCDFAIPFASAAA